MDSTCSSEGRCTCRPGVVGDKCNQCESYHTDLSPSGCRPCNQCEQNIRTNLTAAANEHNNTSTNLVQFMYLQQANISGFEEVDRLVSLLQDNLTTTDQYLDDLLGRLEVLNNKANNFALIVNSTKERVSQKYLPVHGVQKAGVKMCVCTFPKIVLTLKFMYVH